MHLFISHKLLHFFVLWLYIWILNNKGEGREIKSLHKVYSVSDLEQVHYFDFLSTLQLNN